MIKRLSRHGNGMAVVIDRPVLDLLNIDEDTPLEVTTDGNALAITPLRNAEGNARLSEALEQVNRLYGRALWNLAEER